MHERHAVVRGQVVGVDVVAQVEVVERDDAAPGLAEGVHRVGRPLARGRVREAAEQSGTG
jgi:hypothetical protein